MPIRTITDKQYKGVSELYRKSDGEVTGYYVTYRDIDGKPIKIKQAQTGFMTIPVTNGRHTVKLKFIPQGLKLGALCFILTLISFIFYDRYNKKHISQ